MTKIFHDWEFYEDGKTIKPISCAFVAESGEELYLIFDNAKETCENSQWLMENVWPHIQDDFYSGKSVPKNVAKSLITNWILKQFDPELWAWYGAYDHVALAQTLGGPMINLPKRIPMFTNDIKTLQKLAWTAFGPEPFPSGPREKPKQDLSTEHHALYDARHDRELFDYYYGWIR
jgi:hypothetical protein